MIRKNCIMLLAIIFAITWTNSMAYADYGIQGSNTPSSNATAVNTAAPTNQANANSQRDQQTIIANLLQQGKRENKAVADDSNDMNRQQALITQPTAGNPGIDEQAFANTVRNMMPLSPQQIKTLRYLFDRSQRAAATYPGIPPKPTSSSAIVNLSPGATPPIIRLSSGFVTSIVFLDSTGAAWPVQAYDLGNPQSFNIQWNKKSNTLLVQALHHYQSGNLAVILKGLDTPVMITLMPGQNAVDYRVDLRVPGIGPNANPVLSGLPATASPALLQILNGVPPTGSKPLTVLGGNCQAWLLNGYVYLRTRLTVLSPGWIATMSSGDGTHAYELQSTPVVLVSQRGKLIKLVVKGL